MFDFLGDIGGVRDIVSIIAALIVAPIANHTFILRALNVLFVARTKDKHLFLNLKSNK